MCCDTVNRGVAYAAGKVFMQQADSTLVALDAKTGKVVWSVKNGDPKVGAVNTNAPHVFKDKVITGISGGEWGVRGYISAYDINTGKHGVARLQHRAGRRDADRPADHHDLGGRQGAAGRGRLEPEDLAGRPVEDRRRHHLGLVQLRPEAEPGVLRHRQPQHVEPGAAARRQQVVDEHLGHATSIPARSPGCTR